jgi:hypothetical protein
MYRAVPTYSPRSPSQAHHPNLPSIYTRSLGTPNLSAPPLLRNRPSSWSTYNNLVRPVEFPPTSTSSFDIKTQEAPDGLLSPFLRRDRDWRWFSGRKISFGFCCFFIDIQGSREEIDPSAEWCENGVDIGGDMMGVPEKSLLLAFGIEAKLF